MGPGVGPWENKGWEGYGRHRRKGWQVGVLRSWNFIGRNRGKLCNNAIIIKTGRSSGNKRKKG